MRNLYTIEIIFDELDILQILSEKIHLQEIFHKSFMPINSCNIVKGSVISNGFDFQTDWQNNSFLLWIKLS